MSTLLDMKLQLMKRTLPGAYNPNQPGCVNLVCNHLRAVDYFHSSIKKCKSRFIASPSIASISKSSRTISHSSKSGEKAEMGYYASPSASGDYKLSTTASSPFC